MPTFVKWSKFAWAKQGAREAMVAGRHLGHDARGKTIHGVVKMQDGWNYRKERQKLAARHDALLCLQDRPGWFLSQNITSQ